MDLFLSKFSYSYRVFPLTLRSRLGYKIPLGRINHVLMWLLLLNFVLFLPHYRTETRIRVADDSNGNVMAIGMIRRISYDDVYSIICL